jgi:DNA-binding winged helix-turn-helix (wHTH) protein
MSIHGGVSPLHDSQPFTVGDWRVSPMHRRIERPGERRTLEPRHADVLSYLATHADEVVSAERLLQACWGSGFYGDNPVHKTIAMLRKALDDDARAPRYIATVRKRGYQLVAPVASPATTRLPRASTPYRGCHPYGVDDGAVFFGRARALTDLRDTFFEAHAGGIRSIVVRGASACGKTSLVMAGLIASLIAPAARVAFPLAGWSSVTPDTVDDINHLLRSAAPHQRVVIVADGLERMPATLAPMLDRLATDTRVMLIATCRDADLAGCRRRGMGHSLLQTSIEYAVTAPSAGEVASIIRDPARACGLRFGQDPDDARQLDDVLLQDAWKHPGSLPALQQMLADLFHSRDASGVMPFDTYRAVGGIDGALTRHALRHLKETHGSWQPALPRLLRRLALVTADGRLRSPCVPLRSLDEAELALVDSLVDARILASRLLDDQPCIVAPRPLAAIRFAEAGGYA